MVHIAYIDFTKQQQLMCNFKLYLETHTRHNFEFGLTSLVWPMTQVIFSGTTIFTIWPLVPEISHKTWSSSLQIRFRCNSGVPQWNLMNIFLFDRYFIVLQQVLDSIPQLPSIFIYRAKHEFLSRFLAMASKQDAGNGRKSLSAMQL